MTKYIQVIAGLAMNFLLFLLSYVVPKQRDKWLLGGGMGHRFSGNTRFLYQYLVHRRSVPDVPDAHWITKSAQVLQALRKNGNPVYSAWSLPGLWAILRAEFLLIESGNSADVGGHDIAYERLFLGRFNVVQTWHGTPMKRICLDALRDRDLSRFHERLYFQLYQWELSSVRLIIALSDIASERLSSAFDNPNVAITGYPKNDVFFDAPEAWGIRTPWRKYETVIVYAPTFRDYPDATRPFSDEFLARINEHLAARNWVLLIKKHAFDRTLQIPPSMSHVVDVSKSVDDIQELLVQADVLITDYSSVFVDYLLARRPIIFYAYDIERYLSDSRVIGDFQKEIPGPLVRTEKELEEKLFKHSVWFQEPEYTRTFESLVNYHHVHQDGKSCERVTERLRALR
ncbi:CDP-glycerol glycerophosphotransferase family protein [Elongatibacter sediminis]|uniref:CDP-glycerol glycerophosphotransferase family protein n=1 Tax=Elongatibacter sediminis TaxID=3119006 RepID=A0AAW9RIP2_9GAMM